MKYHELRTKIIRDAAKERIPVLGEFELTARCNLACAMCYVVDQTAKDLSTDTWLRIFKSAVDAGLLYAVLTGGEVFMRSDFVTLYNSLYDMGVRITLFSNGTHVPQHALDAFAKRPPENITMTLYGASNATYETVTGKRGAFDRLIKSLDALEAARIPITLRTLPLKPIYGDLDALIEFAKQRGLILHYASYMGPTRQGNFDHASMRLTPEELVDYGQRIERAFGKDATATPTTSTKAATCAALKSAYFVSFEGMMQPCALAMKPARSVLDDTVENTFKALLNPFADVERYDGCASCRVKDDCMQCYARRLLEGDANACAPYLKVHATLKGRAKP